MQTIASRIDSRISTHRQFNNPQGQNSNNKNNNKENIKGKKKKKTFFSQK